MLEEAWEDFRSGFYEVVELLAAAAKASPIPVGASTISPQQTYVRAAIVMLAAHLEDFLKRIPDEYSEAISRGGWKGQRIGVRRYVSLQAIHRLRSAFDEAENCKDEGKRAKLRDAVVETAGWFRDARRFSTYTQKRQIENFYRHEGSKAVDRFLRDFHPRERSFFDWLENRGLDRGIFWTVLEGTVNARNAIAHGGIYVSLTVQDVRRYLAVTTRLVREVRRFLVSR
jgi:hypothetical protein